MKRIVYLLIVSGILLTACKEKKKPQDPEKKPSFPVMSYIKSQIKAVDTSLFSIRKITIYDSTRSDTTFIKREQFRDEAKEFLELPDLADKKYSERYTETRFYDEELNRVIFSVKPIKPEEEEIVSQEVLITPNIATGDKVKNIIINKVINNKDGYLEKQFLWQVDQSFQITTITQAPGQPEKTITVKLLWNEPGYQ